MSEKREDARVLFVLLFDLIQMEVISIIINHSKCCCYDFSHVSGLFYNFVFRITIL